MSVSSRTALLALASSALAVAVVMPAQGEPAPRARTAGPATVAEPPEPMASGIVVRTDDGDVSTSLRSSADRLVDGTVGAARAVVGGSAVLPFDRALPLDEAQDAATALEKRPDVVAAEPDEIATIATDPPVSRNDPLFGQQYQVWDSRSRFSSPSISLPTGGWSVRAPYLWRATTGKASTRVAVIDTGSTVHQDLAGQLVGGYDFFSRKSMDRDPTPGRDADPSDPGDWMSTAGSCMPTDPVRASSWHSTHVSGIIAAVADNGTGVAGIASGVKVEPVRVMGPCGGSTSDIAAAIVWAAGGHVSGVPDNPLPAKVLNLSLGAGVPSCSSTYQSAVTKARRLGAVVVAAAGNESYVDSKHRVHLASLSAPASCSGVVAVVATDEGGQRASYSSVGTSSKDVGISHPRAATLSAPGGESAFASAGYHGIVSTLNSGTTTPAGSTYGTYDGTSMATPAVAAAAALMSSLGYSRSEIERALKYAVRSFPSYSGGGSFNCSRTRCGRGILDLAKVPAPRRLPAVAGTPLVGQRLTVSQSWTGTPSSYAYQWYRDGKAISKATRSAYTATSADRGTQVSVKVWGRRHGFKTLARTSTAVGVS